MQRILLLLIAISTLVWSQQPETSSENKPEKLATAEIAIIAVGPRPPRRYKKNTSSSGPNSGIPIMLPSLPFEIPPSTLQYYISAKKNTKFATLNIPFNNPTKFTTIPAGKSLALLHKDPEDPNKINRYLTIPALEPDTRILFILTPSGTGKNRWKNTPTIRRVTVSAENLIDKNLVIKNISSLPIKHRFNNNTQIIPPNKTLTYPANPGTTLHRITAAVENSNTILYNTAIRMSSPENLHILVLYNANPATNSNRPVGTVKIILQKAPPTPEITTPLTP